MRGRIIKALVGGTVGRKDLYKAVDGDARFESALSSLIRDGMVVQNGELIGLTGADKTS